MKDRGGGKVITNTEDLTHMFTTQTINNKQALLSSKHSNTTIN